MLMLIFSLGCSRQMAMKTPQFEVSSSEQASVHEAIKQALLGRRWVILENHPDSFIAQYNRSDVWARIRVTHSGREVSIMYVSSDGMKYSDASQFGPRISRWYNTWVSNLEADIKVRVGATL